jgi:uncharacterized DUF497 family protein
MIRIAELEFDDYNVEELARHAIRPHEVLQLVDNPFTVRRNRKHRSGQRQLIGRTHGGRALTIILVETPVPDRWRPVTGWDSTPAERSALR